jgi:VWFA-related protein
MLPRLAVWVLAATTIAAAQQRPVFRAGVQFVQVDVVVTDADDRPIRDLTIDDFEVIDRDRPQTIADFRFVDIPITPAVSDPTVDDPPSPDVVSNAAPSAESRLFVLLVDMLHTLEGEIVPIRDVMTDFVRSVAPSDEVAVVYVGRSDLGTNFTTDRARLLRAIDDLRAASGFAVDAMGRTSSSTFVRGRNDSRQYGWSLAATLKQIAVALAGSNHTRRAIVYVGAGSPVNLTGDDRTDWVLFDAMADAYRSAREANVPIYTLDPRGMVQPADAVRGGIGAIGGIDQLSREGVVIGLRNQRGHLATAALNTGGRALLEQSDVSGAMRSIVAENGSFYLLGFYPDAPPREDAFNEIEVRVKRPGAKVRFRRGYHAAAKTDDDATVDQRLATAMTSALDVRGLTMRATVAPLLPAGKLMRTAITVQVTYPMTGPQDLPFDGLRLNVMALDGDARVKASVERAYTVRRPRSEREAVSVIINDVIDLPAQDLTLRIGVASRALARAGTVQLPVEVPRPGDSEIQMGAVVVGTPGAPMPPTLGDDFIRPIVPFQPTTRRSFTQAHTMRIFVPLFWKGREQEARVVLTLDGKDVTLRREERLAAVTVDGRRVTSLDTLIGLEKLRGPFTLRLEATVNGRQTATRELRFDVR